MGVKALGESSFHGSYFANLIQTRVPWLDALCYDVQSTETQEVIRFLSDSPALREWEGERLAKGLKDHSITIDLVDYEGTLAFKWDEYRDDKTPQVRTRIQDLARRTNTHWVKLITDKTVAAESDTAYDGQLWFDTDHTDGAGGTLDNDLTYTTAEADCTDMTVADCESALWQAINAFGGFNDDAGEPIFEGVPEKYLVMVPNAIYPNMHKAVTASTYADDSGNLVDGTLHAADITLVKNPRLDSETNWAASTSVKFVVFHTGGSVKPFIRCYQKEGKMGVVTEFLGPQSDHFFKNKEVVAGVRAERAIGLGMFQSAILTTVGT